MSDRYDKLRKGELEEEVQRRGLPIGGTTEDLRTLLRQSDETEKVNEDDNAKAGSLPDGDRQATDTPKENVKPGDDLTTPTEANTSDDEAEAAKEDGSTEGESGADPKADTTAEKPADPTGSSTEQDGKVDAKEAAYKAPTTEDGADPLESEKKAARLLEIEANGERTGLISDIAPDPIDPSLLQGTNTFHQEALAADLLRAKATEAREAADAMKAAGEDDRYFVNGNAKYALPDKQAGAAEKSEAKILAQQEANADEQAKIAEKQAKHAEQVAKKAEAALAKRATDAEKQAERAGLNEKVHVVDEPTDFEQFAAKIDFGDSWRDLAFYNGRRGGQYALVKGDIVREPKVQLPERVREVLGQE